MNEILYVIMHRKNLTAAKEFFLAFGMTVAKVRLILLLEYPLTYLPFLAFGMTVTKETKTACYLRCWDTVHHCVELRRVGRCTSAPLRRAAKGRWVKGHSGSGTTWASHSPSFVSLPSIWAACRHDRGSATGSLAVL